MLKFLDLNEFFEHIPPVTTSEIFSKKDEFNPDGLFSEKIFGPLESLERRKNFSYIDLHTRVIHPQAYRLLKRLDRRILKFISTEQAFSIKSDGTLVEDEKGELTGLDKFEGIFQRIKFRSDSDIRKKFIKLLKVENENNNIFIDKLPIIPPDFRPIFQMADGNWEKDKLNDVYQSLIRKANQIRSIGKGGGVLFDLLSYSLQLSVNEHDEFIRGRLETKSGLIRQFMMGKRVDFSGRAVITTPGPNLKVNEVGIPFRMAAVLFEPFIIFNVLNGLNNSEKEKLDAQFRQYMNLELSVDGIKQIIKSIKSGDELPKMIYDTFWRICEESMKDRSVICKRDPAIHAESLRASTPILIKGNSIQLCTLQVGGFCADFDGDQMAIYHPLSDEAQDEIKQKMMRVQSGESSKSLVFELSKEMYVGLYLLTKSKIKNDSPIEATEDVLDKATDPYIAVRFKDRITTMGRAILNSCFPKDFEFVDKLCDKKVVKSIIQRLVKNYKQEIVIDSVSKLSKIGFKFATIMSPTITLDDLELPPSIYPLKDKFEKAGLEEADHILQDIKKILVKHLKDTGIYDLIESGSGKGWDQPMQILIAKGIVSDPKGRILDPIKGSFSEGLNSKEFFNASSGARKGIADRVINTSDTGYLSRKLAFVLNSVEADLYKKDCGTHTTLSLRLDEDLISRLNGRYVIRGNDIFSFNDLPDKLKQEGKLIRLRSPIFCESRKVCHTCYGELLRRVKSPYIGIVAAQIIGERSTQLIMKAFHTGGAVQLKKKNVLDDIINNNAAIEEDLEISKYLRQDGVDIFCLKGCVVTINLSDYIINNNIFIDEQKNTISVNSLIAKVEFMDDISFDVILDYPVEFSFDRMEEHRKEFIKLYYKEGDTIFQVSLETIDIKKNVKYVERLMGGKEIFKNVEHLLLKLYNTFKKDSDMDLVHMEVLLSNCLRDENDLSKPARLGKPFSPTLINMKSIVFRTGFLQSLAFEEIGKAIDYGMVYDIHGDRSILERVLVGDIN